MEGKFLGGFIFFVDRELLFAHWAYLVFAN